MQNQSVMKALIEAQELARRFNEAEAVWRLFQQKRELRHLLGTDSPLPESVLDDQDWQAAEREGREARAIGFAYPNP